MSGKVHCFTEEGLEKVKAELAHMISVERPAISKAIAEARDKGDLSENAEYDAAREAQGLLELKISQLQDIIANARVIDESKINTDQVQLLNKVKIKNLANGAVMEYTIVGESEIIRVARDKATEILRRAEDRAKSITNVTNEYADDALRRATEALQAAQDELNESRMRFRAVSAEQLQAQRAKIDEAETEAKA